MQNRKAFTLVELMVVIVVIAVLMSILIPAISAVASRANLAVARVEISGLDTAITTFKSKYGVEPPSTLILCENAADWNLYTAQRGNIRQIWPQFDFTTSRDINGNGVSNEQLKLDAAECLVFFLGGIVDSSGQATGLSTNPANPFQPGGNRIGPFFEFDMLRFTDADNDGFKEYHSKLNPTGHPIVYYSSYEGAGYLVGELCYGMKDFYRITPAGSNPPGYWKPTSYQIVSPGWDGELGDGGLYDSSNPDLYINFNNRQNERDNLTNFVSGKLVP